MKAVLLSGGLDSIALAYWQRPELAVFIDYGQRPAKAEQHAAQQVCTRLGLRQEVIRVDCSSLGSGLLADRQSLPGAPSPEWWPFRNQLLITLALTRLAGTQTLELMLGTVCDDALHADGTRDFYRSINAVVSIQEFRPAITAPAIDMSTVELVQRSQTPAELLLWAHSCQVSNLACGQCRGCTKRLATLQDLGLLPG